MDLITQSFLEERMFRSWCPCWSFWYCAFCSGSIWLSRSSRPSLGIYCGVCAQHFTTVFRTLPRASVIQLNYIDYFGDFEFWGEDPLCKPSESLWVLFKYKSKVYFTRTKFQARPLPEYWILRLCHFQVHLTESPTAFDVDFKLYPVGTLGYNPQKTSTRPLLHPLGCSTTCMSTYDVTYYESE